MNDQTPQKAFRRHLPTSKEFNDMVVVTIHQYFQQQEPTLGPPPTSLVPPMYTPRWETFEREEQLWECQVPIPQKSSEEEVIYKREILFQKNTPFTASIMVKGYLCISVLYRWKNTYIGSSDPKYYLGRFEKATLLHQYIDGVKCRVFLTTLVGSTQCWFNQLQSNPIWSFDNFQTLFLQYFVSVYSLWSSKCKRHCTNIYAISTKMLLKYRPPLLRSLSVFFQRD